MSGAAHAKQLMACVPLLKVHTTLWGVGGWGWGAGLGGGGGG